MHCWGNLDEDAKRIENAETARLAVCNIDWDRITANDLFGKNLCRFKRKVDNFSVCINVLLAYVVEQTVISVWLYT